jgi:hypothetical protein
VIVSIPTCREITVIAQTFIHEILRNLRAFLIGEHGNEIPWLRYYGAPAVNRLGAGPAVATERSKA